MMNAVGALQTLFHLSLSPIRGDTHEARLESFYRGQAEDYDAFRRKFLHGRREMLHSLPVEPGGVWYDIGAGTGESAQVLSEQLNQLSQVYLVDHLPYLTRRFQTVRLDERRGKIPFIPFLRAPHYIFIGRKSC